MQRVSRHAAARPSKRSWGSTVTDSKKLRVTLLRSLEGRTARQRACVAGLGLRRRHHTVELQDTPAIRGMINKVSFMVRVEEVSA
jgi:large subunit ribosomal protein L30